MSVVAFQPGPSPGAAPPVREHGFLAPIALPFELPTPVYGAMLAIWHLVPGIQIRFPLHLGRQRDYVRFLAWCSSEGRRRYRILQEIPAWDAALARPASLPALRGDDWAGAFSLSMLFHGVARQQYSFTAMLAHAPTRRRMALEWWRGERHKRCAPRPAPWQYAELAARFREPHALIAALRTADDADKSAEQLIDELGLTDVLAHFADAAPDVNAAVPTSVTLPAGLRRSPLRLPARAVRVLSRAAVGLSSRPNEFELAGITTRIPTLRPENGHVEGPFGVNLYGYAQGEIGIGEDVRLAARALHEAGIPFCVVNLRPGANVSQLDTSVERWMATDPRYAINLFCVTGKEQARFACEQGLDASRDRYNIGLWPWELPVWPASCRHTYALVDELWGISRHTANAYRDAPCPVRAMSLPVSVEGIGPQTRADFGLPAGKFLFVFSFDLNSTIARKNPQAVVRAFQQAFPAGAGADAEVGLVLKASHVAGSSKGWAPLRKLIERDPRIHLLHDTLRRPQLLALYDACDCYVSLHRAEGFGRGIAEALLLGKQVVATAYSGNMDYCEAQRVGLVRYAMKPLADDDYFHGQGQQWADPDVAHAAQLMREVYLQPRQTARRSFAFTPEQVGARYAQRLLEIKQRYGLR